MTRQRALIWSALTAEPDRHLSAGDIAAVVGAVLPRVHPSTIYRTLDLLVEEGLVLRTVLGAGRVFYEPAHDHPHHHVVCRSCGAVAHVHDDVLKGLRERVDSACGYALVNESTSTSIATAMWCTHIRTCTRPGKSTRGTSTSPRRRSRRRPRRWGSA